MKIARIFASLLLLIAWGQVSAQGNGKQPDTLFQVSTLDALLAGDYEGRASFREVKRHGDFGLGTFVALDGEMVAVDGVYYQVRVDGVATPVVDQELTPFAAVTFFDADDTFRVAGETGCTELHELLQERFPSGDLPYAIKVTGRFTKLTTRSVPAQEKPYPPLVDALQQQVAFNLSDVDATLAGFWLPAFLAGVNVAGFHFHAITADATTGGHVLDCLASDVLVEIDQTDELRVQFSDSNRLHRPLSKHEEGVPRQGNWPSLSHW
ncbi:MAG: acetolactate decarboxylase [Pseudomonadota bacterium]|nr:acetolactate decarboxylase [Pseudomonadota bacterium]